MIEGSFTDVSLPGLLQFLASEPNKSYRVKVTFSGQDGEIFVRGGIVVSANFKLLEGEDALCEFLGWSDGQFGVDLVSANFEIRRNLHLPIKLSTTFVEQTAHLVSEGVGLNTVIKQATAFGTPEWQQSLHLQPLEREDFVTLSWIGDGRSMRQAMREFNFDAVKATGILFRLLSTQSIQAIRPSSHIFAAVSKPSLDVDIDLSEIVGLYSNSNGRRVEAISLSGIESIADAAAQAVDLEIVGGGVGAGTAGGAGYVLKWEPARDGAFASATTNMEDTGETKKIKAEDVSSTVAESSDQSKESEPVLVEAIAAVVAQPVAVPTALQSSSSNSSATNTASVAEVNSQPEVVASPIVAAAATAQPATVADLPQAKQHTRLQGADPARTHSLPVLPKSSLPTPEKTPPPQPFTPARSQPLPQESSIRRTVVLPLVTLDIERLLQSTFTLTQFGKLALTNPTLESARRQTLADVQASKKVVTVLGENTRPPSSVLSAYKYCLDHGYIDSHDPVIQLTAELLLGRIEIEQYLLQRRRITGDELRDLLATSRSEGIRLPQLLVRSGYLTAGDLDTLSRELGRFSQ